jgi:uncharacterized protein YjbI with pentapeptide repeats
MQRWTHALARHPRRASLQRDARPSLADGARVLPTLLVLVALLGAPGTARAAGYKPLSVETVQRMVSQGQPVVEEGVEIRGSLRLPKEVRATLVLRNSHITGDLLATSTEFRSIVDLTGTSIDGRSDFSFAELERVAVFEGTSFTGPASFAKADFHGVAAFRSATFSAPVDFTHASFDRVADLAFVTFKRKAVIADVDFRGVVDLEGSTFSGSVSFDDSRFEGQARFTGRIFDTPEPASFLAVRFDGGADFSGVSFGRGAVFDLSEAQGNLGFQQATFQGDASFSTVQYSGKTDFSGASFHGFLNFDQAIVESLDLGDASLGKASIVFPRLGRTREDTLTGQPIRGGRITELRLDPGAVARIRVGDPNASRESRETRERALGLVETGARRGGDLDAANEARILRWNLERKDWPPVLRELNWAVGWEVGGYLLSPIHPALAIVGLFLIGVLVRALANLRWRRKCGMILAGLGKDASNAFSAFAKIRRKGASRLFWAEALSQKILVLVLIASVGDVWPSVRTLVEEVLP